MYLIAGVVYGNFDANAGLIFKAARKSVQYSFESGYRERRQKKSCLVSSLLPEIAGDSGLYCRRKAEVGGGGWTGWTGMTLQGSCIFAG
jgi:hypothetical protein